MNEIKIQRDILKQVIKSIVTRIKELQTRLEGEKEERRDFGIYADCGDFYREQVIKTESIIEELVRQKITLEKWHKKLKYELNTDYGRAATI